MLLLERIHIPVVLGSDLDRTTLRFQLMMTVITFLVFYIDRLQTRSFLYFLYSQILLLFFISILHFINIQFSRVEVCRPIDSFAIKRIYHHAFM